ncbi:MAG: hypothetical protein EH225_10135 [Calditrichaeota bacterium]|nr:hypothetical protein [Calditrichota bacterium]RQW00791.1 MAG: hypothetical protein EH225_10135 [Calditrichota bacterium]
MLGKGAILTVFGFILAFSMYQVRMSSNVLATSDNFNGEFVKTMIHETAISSMNMAINKIWQISGPVPADTYQVRANHCTSNVRITPVGGDTVKINVRTWGYLYDPDLGSSTKQNSNMTALFTKGPSSSLTDYLLFQINSTGFVYTTGCTLSGPCHTNSVIHTLGQPVFYGKMTAKQGINPDPAKPSNKAEYHGGWEIGVEINPPTDMSPIINQAIADNGGAPTAGGAAYNAKCVYNQPTSFTFLADGNVIRQVGANPPDTVSLASIAPNGAIISTAEVRVQGILNGAVTIYTTDNIFIDNDLVYADDPRINLYSDDIIGLVAQNDIIIADNAANNDGINIDACIYAVNGSFEAEHWNTRPKAVEYFMGSLAEYQAGSHGAANSSGSVNKGFERKMIYDPRLAAKLLRPPHFFTFGGNMSLTSWWE